MQPAPTFNDWKALRLAVLALIAAGVTGQAREFLKAVREAKAAALVLLFALARSLWPEEEDRDEQAWKPYKPPGPSRLGSLRLTTSEDAWRNPPAVAFRMDNRRSASRPPKAQPNPQRLPQRVTHAFQVLQHILALCDDRDARCCRRRRRLDLAACAADLLAIFRDGREFARSGVDLCTGQEVEIR